MKIVALIWALLVGVVFFACKKDSFITSANATLRITQDTLKYDTLFASTGSITKSFKIINENSQKLKLSSIKLMGGSSSAYKMNVDGVPGAQINNIEVNANDSVYVFVQVNIDQNAKNLPFIVSDSIEISYNGNMRFVQLEAWGQNAHFFRNKQIQTDEVWNNDLPYVILGYLYVEEGQTLTINKGCRVYVHADAPIIVDGRLNVKGEKDSASRVYFQGDRLDEPHKDFPASWPGIYFSDVSNNNLMTYAVIKNGYQSVVAEQPSNVPGTKLILNQCIIDNAYDVGLMGINTEIEAINCLISNCGKNIVLQGGNYAFTHCTAAGYTNSFIEHKNPVLSVSNFVNNVSVSLQATFRNCIFWGDEGRVDNEVFLQKSGAVSFNVLFENNLWRLKNGAPGNSTIVGAINNQDPLFDSISVSSFKPYFNFRLKTGSPAINAGINAAVLTDLDGSPRPVNLPDLGCFEKQ